MRSSLCAWLVVGALLSAAAAQTSGAKAASGGNSADETAIRALEHNFAEAVKAKDLDKIMSSYEHGQNLVVFDVVPPREYVGWDAYKADWQKVLGTFSGAVTFEISGLEVTAVGNLAYGYSFQHVAGKTTNGNTMDVTVRVTDVYRKSGGKWLIVHEHVSVPVDLDSGKADLQSKQ